MERNIVHAVFELGPFNVSGEWTGSRALLLTCVDEALTTRDI